MLTTLSISQFAIAEKLNLEFQPGMTAITGETGAGKSISLDALSLTLGARADSHIVRSGCDKADIRAVFDITKLPLVQQWLNDHDFADDPAECILRRVITSEGRSKAYINDQPVNLSTLKNLGDKLVDIHSQHAHHQLLQREHHQTLLDAYIHDDDLLSKTANLFQQWHNTQKQVQQLLELQSSAEQRKQFLQFQLDDFNTLSLEKDEYENLEQEHAMASHADALVAAYQQALILCKEHEKFAISDQLQRCQQLLAPFTEYTAVISEISGLLDNAAIQVEEAQQSLRDQLRHMESSNYNLPALERRLSDIMTLARKNRVLPNQLVDLQQRLQQELDNLSNSHEQLDKLEQQAAEQYQAFAKSAMRLSQAREKARKVLEEHVHQQLTLLGMAHCRFQVVLNSNAEKPTQHGFESVEFLISTNPASPTQSLHKIASGGELSRISLAIQVVTAKASTIPVLIFDEVDVGIGGATAEVVGRLLQQLSQSAQIICVTHQAQVASFAHQHFLVSKSLQKNGMNTQVQVLNADQKTQEIARMIGGVEITQATLNHASEMITKSQKEIA